MANTVDHRSHRSFLLNLFKSVISNSSTKTVQNWTNLQKKKPCCYKETGKGSLLNNKSEKMIKLKARDREKAIAETPKVQIGLKLFFLLMAFAMAHKGQGCSASMNCNSFANFFL